MKIELTSGNFRVERSHVGAVAIYHSPKHNEWESIAFPRILLDELRHLLDALASLNA